MDMCYIFHKTQVKQAPDMKHIQAKDGALAVQHLLAMFGATAVGAAMNLIIPERKNNA